MRRPNRCRIWCSNQPSKTVPGRALSVRQINERFVQGKPIPPAKQPIHEPHLETGINPMRTPYCDYTDVFNYNNDLQVQLNKAESLLTEKRQAFDNAVAESQRQHNESLIQEAQRRLQNKPL